MVAGHARLVVTHGRYILTTNRPCQKNWSYMTGSCKKGCCKTQVLLYYTFSDSPLQISVLCFKCDCYGYSHVYIPSMLCRLISVCLSFFPFFIRRFHHVSSVDRNIAVNIWWSPSARPHLPDCNLPNTTLDQLKFHGFTQLYSREVIDGIKWVVSVQQ